MSHLSEEALANLAEQERNRTDLPLTNWESLSAQLRGEGIIRDPVVGRVSGNQWWLRAAAAILLLAGGAVAGRYSANGSPGTADQVASQSLDAQYVSPVSESSAPQFKSAEEAWDVLNRAGAEYQRASAYLASRNESGTVDSTNVYQARLAALDGMTSASQKALYEAPHDPVINQYYLAAQGAREATLRQLDTSLPSGQKLVKW